MKRMAAIGWAMVLAALLVSFNETEASVTVAAATGIEGAGWLLVEVSGIPFSPLAGARRPFLKFDAAKKEAKGFAGCNSPVVTNMTGFH